MNFVISVSDHIIWQNGGGMCFLEKTFWSKKFLTKNYYLGSFCSAFPVLCSSSFASLPRAAF